jgi:ferrochelatase
LNAQEDVRNRSGLLLVNLGTPDSTAVPDVRKYLREFLSDPRVLDLPAPLRSAILHLTILPFRPRQAAEAYEKVWTERGSPLLFHGLDLVQKVKPHLPNVPVELAMRYQSPSIASALENLHHHGVDRVVVFPLFPQYSSAAWGSAVEKVFVEATKLWNVPAIQVIPPFYDHPQFLDACAATARPVLENLKPDRVLMSFHGLPERHCSKSDASGGKHCFQSDSCCDTIVEANRSCYRAQCFQTAKGIAARLGLDETRYQITFQSRLGRDPWIRPYTDEVVIQLAKSGIKKVAILSPAFVADCLETLEELAIRAREDFKAHGGDELQLVPSLNSEDAWVDAVLAILRENSVLAR